MTFMRMDEHEDESEGFRDGEKNTLVASYVVSIRCGKSVVGPYDVRILCDRCAPIALVVASFTQIGSLWWTDRTTPSGCTCPAVTAWPHITKYVSVFLLGDYMMSVLR